MNKILVVEDEVNTSELLRRYFEIVGYDVVNAQTGEDALKMAAQHSPEVIILDIMLPDIDGYEVCKQLRSNDKTDRIPVIFLTQKDERSDRLEGLRLGADDYIAKPFDVEELRLRVHNIIANSGGTMLVDARTSLPNLDLMKERLPKLLDDSETTFLDAIIERYDPFKEQYGQVAANQVLRATAKMISDILHETGNRKSFIGHPDDKHFVISTKKDSTKKVTEELSYRFDKRVKVYYDTGDQGRGHMLVDKHEIPFMKLKISQATPHYLRKMLDSD